MGTGSPTSPSARPTTRSPKFQAGAFHVLRGSRRGITPVGGQIWTQDTPGVLDRAEPFDFFGFALRAGDSDGDGHVDLATWAGEEDFAGLGDPGALHVIFGTAHGLAAGGNARFTQATSGIEELAEAGDGFESVLRRAQPTLMRPCIQGWNAHRK